MKVLLSHRFFWPDTAPYAFLLRAIAEDLSSDGLDVHVYSSKPSYRKGSLKQTPSNELLGAIRVQRCYVFQEQGASTFIRAINVLLYTCGLFLKTLSLKPDVVTASTFPPVFAGYMASLGAKMVGARFIYHMQDIHPEVSELSGGFMGKAGFSKIFRFLDNQTLKRSAAIVVLSRDMENTLRKRGLGELPIHVINNFALASTGQELADPIAKFAKDSSRKRIIFAGNLGRFQNLKVLAEGVAICLESNAEYELVFLGDGKMADELKAQWKSHPQVKFIPFLPIESALPLIAESDVGLVSLAEDIYKVAYPSKMSTYLGLGVPVLVLTDSNSEMASEIEKAGVGVVPVSTDAEDIARALGELLSRELSRKSIVSWYELNFSRDVSSLRWRRVLDSVS